MERLLGSAGARVGVVPGADRSSDPNQAWPAPARIDFFLGFNVLENYENRPRSAAARMRDYRYGFSVGWSWN